MGTRPRNSVGTFGKSIAEALEQARHKQQVSQMQLQEKTGISQSQLSKMLRGLKAINLDELNAICTALQINPSSILEVSRNG